MNNSRNLLERRTNRTSFVKSADAPSVESRWKSSSSNHAARFISLSTTSSPVHPTTQQPPSSHFLGSFLTLSKKQHSTFIFDLKPKPLNPSFQDDYRRKDILIPHNRPSPPSKPPASNYAYTNAKQYLIVTLSLSASRTAR